MRASRCIDTHIGTCSLKHPSHCKASARAGLVMVNAHPRVPAIRQGTGPLQHTALSGKFREGLVFN